MSENKIIFVNIRMPVAIVAQIDELATEGMRSRSAQIIYLLTQVLSRQDSLKP
jgi:hypothetical protein